MGGFFYLNSACVMPSPRFSGRVPFGTGPAVQEIVNNIRKDYDTGNYRNRDLVKKYNTTSTNISRIVLRKTWK